MPAKKKNLQYVGPAEAEFFLNSDYPSNVRETKLSVTLELMKEDIEVKFYNPRLEKFIMLSCFCGAFSVEC